MTGPISPPLLRRPARKRPLISLTPLIDVVFILLVFFMLASSFLDWRAIDLNAPAQAAARSASPEGALLVEIRPDGLRLSAEPLSLETLAKRVAARLAAKPGQRVLIKPSAGVPLQRTVRVLDELKAVGTANVSLIRDSAR
ncbi:MAG: biopolymer transporter ExbD [Alphaproteobacteria bacterium]|nr:biopolymer transporter ExbD [Alphaproteobacteria bacterium]